jgi:hypothetical protein
MDPAILKRLLAALEARQVVYAVFGAMAMALHGLPRFTQDLDLFIAPEADNVVRLKQALQDVVDDPAIDEISSEDLLGDYPAVQYTPPDQSFSLDVLTRLGEAYGFVDLQIDRVPYEDLTVSVVSPRTLYEMKKGTVRPKDRIDASWIRDRFQLED